MTKKNLSSRPVAMSSQRDLAQATRRFEGLALSPAKRLSIQNRLYWIVSKVEGERVLDVGTGEGLVPILLGREGFRVVGIDIDEAAIEIANAALESEPDAVRDRIQFQNVSVFQEPSDLQFDTVILGNVLHQIGNVGNFLRLAVSHLQDGGKLIITVPMGNNRRTPANEHAFFPSDLLTHLAPVGKFEYLMVENDHIYAVVVCRHVEEDLVTIYNSALVQVENCLASFQVSEEGMQNDISDVRRSLLREQVKSDGMQAELDEVLQKIQIMGSELKHTKAELSSKTQQVLDIASEFEFEKNAKQRLTADLSLKTELLKQADKERINFQKHKEDIDVLRADLATQKSNYENKIQKINTEYASEILKRDNLQELMAQEKVSELEAQKFEYKSQIQKIETKHASEILKRDNEHDKKLEKTVNAFDKQRATDLKLLAEAREYHNLLEQEIEVIKSENNKLRYNYAKLKSVASEDPKAELNLEDLIDFFGDLNVDQNMLSGDLVQQCDDIAYENEEISTIKTCIAKSLAMSIDPSIARIRELGENLLAADLIAPAAKVLSRLDFSDARSSREERLWRRVANWWSSSAELSDWHADDRPLTRSALRVATIMDEFTYHSYAPECDLMQLSVDHWERELEDFAPEMLFIESAWRGKDEKWGPKVGHLSEELRGVLAWCRANNVPSIFWNKEDPVHFQSFLNTAAQFDIVFTTDADQIGAYKQALKHENVYFLPFAAQPELCNPIESYDRLDAFCFAGAYYARYPERTRDLETFVNLLPTYRPLEIYDRNYDKKHPDYMFPESYRPYIVGTLAPTEIDRAYKGYRFGINLNSIKDSQTMFARRVYELLASNTVTVSNFSRGVRQMFGDLVISTDSGAQALARIEQIDAQMGPRFQLAGLRKVLSEHTYSHRISYITQKVGLPLQTTGLESVVVLAAANTLEMAQGLVAQFMRQTWTDATMVLVVPDAQDFAGLAEARVTIRTSDSADVIEDVVPAGARIAGMVAQDYYGPNYLTDLILSTHYTAAPVIGKASRHVVQDGEGIVLENDGAAYRAATDLPNRCSLIAQTLLAREPLSDWLADLPHANSFHKGCFAVDPYNYCQNGSDADPEQMQTVVDDVPLNPGLPLPQVQAEVEQLAANVSNDRDVSYISGADLSASMVKPKIGNVDWELGGEDWIMTSYLPSENHTYLYQNIEHSPADMMPDGTLKLHLDTAPGLNLYCVVFFLDEDKKKISHQMVTANRDATFDLPEGTAWLRLGVRVYGPGYGAIKRLILGHQAPQPVRLLETRKHLVLTNHYPSHDDLYRNGFVHSRLKAYRARGVEMDVFRLRPTAPTQFHEFEGVDVVTGSTEQLDDMLTYGNYESVNVHFLDAAMWEVLARHIDRIRVNVWIHGSEVQPWWRRQYNYADDPEGLEIAKAESDVRLAFWRDVLTPMPENLHLIFVSKYFAEEVMEDLGLRCPEDRYSIIHNPIDTDVFRFVPKTADQRLKIFSIRPFASAKYANDLSVKAVLMLRDRAFFDELDIRIIGDGKLFDEILEPLQGLTNVQIERRFLSQLEIANLHQQYGVFLNPTRMDAQGVSRDEAMSSGLVPVTTDVAAIPEFVDANCGYLANFDDSAGLAAAIEDMYRNPDKFLLLSQAAAARVREQSGAHIIIAAELDLITNGAGSTKKAEVS